MKTTNRSPFTHGMEIEQFPGNCPREVRDHVMNNGVGSLTDWHHDASGPRETDIGPYKNCKTILNKFLKGTRGEGVTWDWHAADSRSGTGRGAGSHVHLCVEDIFDDSVTAWTIAYNTVVETFPFFAPFFCHDWERGFRHGTEYSGYAASSQLNVRRWADAQTTRLSQSSVRERVENTINYHREYKAVTFNPPRGSGKPATIELRVNDAHPSTALAGLKLIRRVTGRAIEEGWSPKLENHEQTLQQCYEKIYDRATEVGLITAMKEPVEGGITFQEGRGIPAVDKREFDTMWDVLRAIQIAFPQTPKSWSAHVQNLIRDGVDEVGPQNNTDALWRIDADDFEWDVGAGRVDARTHVDAADEGADDRQPPAPGMATRVATDGGEN